MKIKLLYQLNDTFSWERGIGVEGEEETERVRYKTGEEIRVEEVPSLLTDGEAREK